MRNNWKRLAAAMLLALIVVLGTIAVFRQTAPAAYALEQTLEANAGLRYIHVRTQPPGSGVSEAWAQFGDSGELLRLRMIFPNTPDGAKEVLWQEDKAEVWFKTKGHVLVVHEREMLERMPQMLAALDPRMITEQLHQAQASGKGRIETRGPSEEGDPITLVGSSTDFPNRRSIFQIDPQTKLVEKFEQQRLIDGEWKVVLRLEYLEYNQEVPPGTFVLDVRSDVTRIDWTTQEVGLSKGDLTDDQIAVKVAREFYEALIGKDYARAGTLLSGMPASKVEEVFGKTEFLQIVSVGEPTPHPDPRTGFLVVPCEVEVCVEGQTGVEKFTPKVRALYNQPDRWSIDGF